MASVKRGDFGELYFSIKLDAKPLEAVLFPAAKHSALRTDVARQIYGFDEHSADNKAITEADGATLTYRLMNVEAPRV